MASIDLQGDEELARILNTNLEPAIQSAAVALAGEVEGRIAPYPSQPSPRHPNRWYERGYGAKYRRKDGTVTGKKTSQTLGRRWSIKTRRLGAVLSNTARYAAVVHSAADQAKIHAATGWKTDQGVIDDITNDGTAEEFVGLAVARSLQGAIYG